MKSKIGQAIKNERIKRHMSLRTLGEITGIQYRTICLWENGGGNISAVGLFKIATALDMPIEEFAKL